MNHSFNVPGLDFGLLTRSPIEARAEDFVRNLLSNALNTAYTFHNVRHTAGVVEAASQLSTLEKCSEPENEIVKLAALFHDTGFTRTCNHHEKESISIANAYLLDKKYPKDRLDRILKCIDATKQNAKANCKLEMILQDADMAHLASDQYFLLLADLRSEVASTLNRNYSDRQWLSQNLDFLLTHSYKTDSAQRLWNENKKRNIQRNRQLLAFSKASNTTSTR